MSDDHSNNDNGSHLNTKMEKFVNEISARIIIMSVLVIFILVGILGYQLHSINSELDLKAIQELQTIKDYVVNGSGGDLLARTALEHDAQGLRTLRGQSLLAAKLFTHSLAILAGILMMTMGSSFIFARIKTGENKFEASFGQPGLMANASPEQAATMAKERARLVMSSYSPGLFFALFGSVVIIVALFTSANRKIYTSDEPVFLQQYNIGTPENGKVKSSLLDGDGNYIAENECKVLGHLDPSYCKPQIK